MLISVVNNVLDFTKMERGKFKLNNAPFNPYEVIQEVILGLTIQAKRKNLSFIRELDKSTDRKIYGDAFQFRQILINIMSNAIKYSEKGTITILANFIKSNDNNGVLEVKINDTGIGISSDRLAKIFDEYNSQTNNSEIKEGSTGLGLSIVKRIVDYHQGELKVDSELGKGSTFTIKLPYQAHLKEDIDLAPSDENKSLSKILIVENDQLNIKILNLLFVNENYSVSNCTNGTEALESHIQNDYDLIITDISMPGLSGFELARKIRELPDSKKSSIPIIAITGFERPEDFQNQQSDINVWITKPFEKDELLLEINKLCN